MIEAHKGTTSYGRENLIDFLKGGSRSAELPAGFGAKGANADGPPTIVSLSPDAKAVLEQLNSAHEAANDLHQEVVRLKKGAQDEGTPFDRILFRFSKIDFASSELFSLKAEIPTSLAELSDPLKAEIFDPLTHLQKTAASGFEGQDLKNLEDIERRLKRGEQLRLDRPTTEAERVVDGVASALASKVVRLENDGQVDKAQHLRDAMASGNVEIRRASDVPDLNLTRTVSFFADAGGGGSSTSMTSYPVGEVKEEFENDRSIIIGMKHLDGKGDHGAFYINW